MVRTYTLQRILLLLPFLMAIQAITLPQTFSTTIQRRKPGGGQKTLDAIEEAQTLEEDRVKLPIKGWKETGREDWEDGGLHQDVFKSMTGIDVDYDHEVVTINEGYQNVAIVEHGVLVAVDNKHAKASPKLKWNQAAYQLYHNEQKESDDAKDLKWVVRWKIITPDVTKLLDEEASEAKEGKTATYKAGSAKFKVIMDTVHAEGAGHILSDFAISNDKRDIKQILVKKYHDEEAAVDSDEEEELDSKGKDKRKRFWCMIIEFTDPKK